MNNNLKNIEDILPKNSCSFCSHLTLEGPNENYLYDIKCVLLNNKPKPNQYCEYFEQEHTNLNMNDLDNLYMTFLETCLRIKYDDYLNSIYWKLFREKVLKESNYKCSTCNSSENINVYHINKNLGRESLKDVTVMCDKCFIEHNNTL